ncbi:formyl peptide receptor-related sequence 3-like [Spea bombifrons]|uniref:formyl peptide receptor-related sequence 3-like n=1 Tax=Spea bombifrons TaxID=233779 RepID=UPI00234AC0BC|nr:formyl peptide receptor-related sequence 3-like [Spea bombifrons]
MEINDIYADFLVNATSEDPPEDHRHDVLGEGTFRFVKIMTIICYSITFVMGIIGNGLVIWIAGFKMKRMVTTIWFLNLGVTDFVFDMFFPLQITEWAMDGHWPFGQIMCKVIFTVLYLNIFVSISFLLIISIDRCTSVMCPVWSKNHRTPRLARNVSIVTWILCFSLSCPYLSFYDVHPDPFQSVNRCLPVFADEHTNGLNYKAMVITQFVAMFVIPFTIIVLCYSLIVVRLRQSRSLSGSNRPFRVITAIVLGFFCSWFPFHFWPLVELMDVKVDIAYDFIVFHVFCCLAFFNSCLNPILYVFIGRDFKKSLIRSIPFILENTFKEKWDIEDKDQHDRSVTGTELVSFHP